MIGGYKTLPKLLPLPQPIITNKDTEIPLHASSSIYRRHAKMIKKSKLHNGCYPLGFSLPMALCHSRHVTSVLTKLSYY